MNCKPGDLAVVISGRGGLRDRIGMVFRVVKLVSRDQRFGAVWECEASHPVQFYLLHETTGEIRKASTFGTKVCMPDDWLRPLPGAQDVISFDQQIEKPESVGA